MKFLRYSFLFFLQIFGIAVFSQKKHLQFTHLGRSDGLSQSFITCIIQDKRGLMWFGSYDGLNKYDGYKITRYKSNIHSKNSLSNNNIKDLFEDSKGDLWIATSNGFNRFNRDKENFDRFTHDNTGNSISGNAVNAITEDKLGNIWLGCDQDGLNKSGLQLFNPAKNTLIRYDSLLLSINDIIVSSQHQLWIAHDNGIAVFDIASRKFIQNFKHDPADKTSVSESPVMVIFEDSYQNIWAGTRNSGLELWDKKTNSFKHFVAQAGKPNSISNNAVTAIMEDENKNLWIGTENGGINVLDLSNGFLTHYLQDDLNPASLQSNSIHSLYTDAKGDIWVGTQKGIDLLNPDTKKFNHIQKSQLPGSLNYNTIFCIRQGSDDDILIATDGGGLNIMDERTGEITQMVHDPKNKNSICGNHVISVLEDSYQNIWIGTWGDGLTVYNKNKKTYKHYKHIPSDPYSLGGVQPWTIYEDSGKNIWIGTYWGGLSLYDREKDRFITYRKNSNDPTSISSNVISTILEDKEGNLWVGTAGGGLCMLNRKTNKFTNYVHEANKNSIPNNSISMIYEDRKGNLWMASSSGLIHLDRKTDKFTLYNSENGLLNDYVQDIIGDDNGNLWLNTSDGICRFNPETITVKNYTISAKWQGGFRSALRKKDGKFLMGGMDGIVEYDPNNMSDIKYDPPIVFTSFQVFNEEVPIADSMHPESLLKQSITETKKITLSYKSSVVSFEFASLNFVDQSKKQYSYMLEGFDKGWNDVGNKHTATYTNLDPGDYFFKVRASDNEGNWSPAIASIELVITPPFWVTWWFRISFILAIAGIVVGSYYYRVSNIRYQKEKLQKLVDQQTKQLLQSSQEEHRARQFAEEANKELERKNKELEQFAFIASHDMQEPLRTASNFAGLLQKKYSEKLDEKANEYFTYILQSTERMRVLIKDLLDYSRIGRHAERTRIDCNIVLKETLADLAITIKESQADIRICTLPTINGYSTEIKQLFQNLLVNAIKFRKEDVAPVVEVLAVAENGFWKFSVKDNGIGINKKYSEKIFTIFQRLHSRNEYEGSGIGLAHCKKIVEMHNGKIWIESEPEIGTTFYFTIRGNNA